MTRGRKAAVGVLVVGLILTAVAKRLEYCRLCGKSRCVRAVRLLGWDFGAKERHFAASDVLEPIVHGNGSPHEWVTYVEKSELGWLWSDHVENRFVRFHYGATQQRQAIEGDLRGLAYWDADAARAAARRLLSPDDDWEFVVTFKDTVGYVEARIWPDWDGISRVRALCGVPEPQATGGPAGVEAQNLPGVARDRDAIARRGAWWLARAAAEGRLEIAKVLIEAGVDVGAAEGRHGNTPLHDAALHNRHEMVKLLLDAGADPGASNDEGVAPLHVAALHGSAECAALLLAAGAMADAQDESGRTALYCAADVGSMEVCRLVLAYGANVQLASDDANTPLVAAEERGHEAVAALLREHGAAP